MNNKGFTLIELLGVIVLLSVLGIIAISTIDKNIKEGRIKTCRAQKKNIIEGAKSYSIDNPDFEGDLTIKNLEDGGYIKDDLINPMTDKEYNDNSYVNVVYDNKYTYELILVDEKGCD